MGSPSWPPSGPWRSTPVRRRSRCSGPRAFRLVEYGGGEKPGAGGTATLYVNGKSVGSARVGKTEFAIFSADETASVGVDLETPVSETYDLASSRFTGTIDKVTVNLK